MKTSTRFSRSSSALAVALAMAGGMAGAAAPEASGRPAAKAERSCAQSMQAGRYAREGALSEHLRKVLGTDEANLDGRDNPCRLEDGYFGENVYLNFGPDSTTVLEQIEDLLAQLRALAGEEEEAPADAGRRVVQLEVSALDHLLHAFLFEGGRKIDLGPLGAHDDAAAAPGQRFVLWHRPSPPAEPAAPAGALLAVPEPSGYAMLLAGMLLLGALRLRRPRAPQRP